MSFAISAITIQGAGVLNSALGARNAAIGQQNALRFQADMSDINARMSEQAAQSALLAGQRQEQRVRMQAARVKGSQKTSLAANGIDLGGSDLTARVLGSTEFMAQSDALTINANATQQAEAMRMQKVNASNDANLRRATAEGISPDSAFSSSLISGASQVSSNWYMMNKYGAIDQGLKNWGFK